MGALGAAIMAAAPAPKRARSAATPPPPGAAAEATAAEDTQAELERRLKRFRVRRIVKENHGEEITHVVFNRVDPIMAHMLATVGGRQLNVYDNEHGGDHLDLVSHYVDDASGDVVRRRGLASNACPASLPHLGYAALSIACRRS